MKLWRSDMIFIKSSNQSSCLFFDSLLSKLIALGQLLDFFNIHLHGCNLIGAFVLEPLISLIDLHVTLFGFYFIVADKEQISFRQSTSGDYLQPFDGIYTHLRLRNHQAWLA